MKKHLYVLSAVFLLSSIGAAMSPTSTSIDSLRYGFTHPHDSARTKVWWFHGETISTHEGITADLEAFKQQGVGGVVYYDQVHGHGEGAYPVFSAPWWDELIFSSQEARRLGLSFECNASNGYVAGGRWITPDKSMQRLYHTELIVEGGRDLQFRMPLTKTRGNWHSDVALIAIPYDVALMSDSREVFSKDSIVKLADPSEHTYINIDMGEGFVARSITYMTGGRGKARTSSMQVPSSYFLRHGGTPIPTDEFNGCGFRVLPPIGELQVSDNGIDYRTVCSLRPKYKNLGGEKEQTIAFPATRGRYFRIALHDWTTFHKADQQLTFGNMVLSSRALVDAWQEKASLISEFIEGDSTPHYASTELPDFSRAIDLTALMQDDGTVTWRNAPSGRWLLLRFFSASGGGHTKHGRADALGLECDKLSVDGARLQWSSYVKPIIDSIRAHGGALSGICMDSHEAGPQNWTVGFEDEFLRLRGYDLRPYLPALAGFVVGSAEETDRFLHDFRQTISDLIGECYFAEFNRLCRDEGLTLTAQAIGGALCMAGDAIGVKRHVDKPQAEFWGYQTEGNYDIKDCSSAAHLYGKPIASGEAFTDITYKHTLSGIKRLADNAYAFGINEFVVCAVAYQPWVRKEGEPLRINTANGRQYVLNRLNTFYPASRSFWDYQARCSWLLRQGKPVSDFCIYLGDDIPCRIMGHQLPALPYGYDFDAFTTDALMHRMNVKDGRIVLPDGVSYRMMILPLGELSLSEDIRHRISLFRRDGVPVFDPHAAGTTLPEAIREAAILPDVESPSAKHLQYCHRRTSSADIYFLSNTSDTPIDDTFTLNSFATHAELWHPVTGDAVSIESTPHGERTTLRLTFAPGESYFVVLCRQETSTIAPIKGDTAHTCSVHSADSAWSVTFSADMGGKSTPTMLDRPTDWTLHTDPRIKYYSGPAVYRNTYTLKRKNQRSTYQIHIPLLNSTAEVLINGTAAGTLWCSPWSLDITPYLKRGENRVELRVRNSLWNRLVRDAQLPASERITWQTHPLAQPTDRLIPSGIHGEVTISEYRDARGR